MRHDLYTNCRYKLNVYDEFAIEESDQQNIKSLFYFALWAVVGPSGRPVYGVGLRPLASQDFGFEYGET